MKVPYTPDAGRASATDPTTWTSFEGACAGSFDGIGFCLSEDDPHCVVDLDNCRDPKTGEIEVWAAKIVSRLDSYTEISPSGRGVHVWMRAEKPGPRCRLESQNGLRRIEIYDRDQFITVTGNRLPGSPESIEERGEELRALYVEAFGEPEPVLRAAVGARYADEEIVAAIRNRPLWRGDQRGYISRSEADQALASLIARYSSDPEQIYRLMWLSGLKREKWRRAGYLNGTIEKALRQPVSRADSGTLATLYRIEAAKPWASAKGNAATTRWNIWRALLAAAREHGHLIPSGVRLSISYRELAERAGCTTKTAGNHLRDMRLGGDLRFDNLHRTPAHAGAVVLLLPEDDSKLPHSSTQWRGGRPDTVESVVAASRFRRSLPGLPRLGPGAGRVLEALIQAGGDTQKGELAASLNTRTSNLTRRGGPLDKLEQAGVVERDGGEVRLTAEWRDKLEQANAAGLEAEQDEVQRLYHHLERRQRDHDREDSELSGKRRDQARDEHDAAKHNFKEAREAGNTERRSKWQS